MRVLSAHCQKSFGRLCATPRRLVEANAASTRNRKFGSNGKYSGIMKFKHRLTSLYFPEETFFIVPNSTRSATTLVGANVTWHALRSEAMLLPPRTGRSSGCPARLRNNGSLNQRLTILELTYPNPMRTTLSRDFDAPAWRIAERHSSSNCDCEAPDLRRKVKMGSRRSCVLGNCSCS